MVTVPKKMNKYCRKCCKHTSQKVILYKKGKVNPMKQGERRYRIKMRGYGGQKKPIFHRKSKNSKKNAIKRECSDCKSRCNQVFMRAKRVILSDAKKTKGESLVY